MKKIYFFIVSVLLAVIAMMGNMAYQEMRDIKELGKVSLYPVKVEAEKNIRKEGNITYVNGSTYYIIYEYTWEGITKTAKLSCDEIYSQNNQEKAKAAVENQEIINRYLYLDNLQNIHFSECKTKEAFLVRHVKNEVLPYVIMLAIILFPGVFWTIISFAKKKEIDFVQSQRPDAVICTGVSFIICILFEVGIILTIMGSCLLANCAGESLGMMACGVLFTFMGLFLSIMFLLHILNRRVVLDKGEVLFKNVFGKEKRFSKSAITECRKLNYSVYSGGTFITRRNFYIKAGDEIIAMNDCMSNYYQAIEFANKNYVCKDA